MADDPRYRVGVGGLSPEELGEKLREAIAAVERIVPNVSIALFVFDKPPRTGLGYISSAMREDVATAVGNWTARIHPTKN
jgi:hypothetical protein